MAIVGRFGRLGAIRQAVCTVSEEVGDLVYIDSSTTPPYGYDSVRKADPYDIDKLPAIGVIISKQDSYFCRVQWEGEIPTGIFTGLRAGELYFLGADAKLALQPPHPGPGQYTFVQSVAVATSDTKIYVRPNDSLTKLIAE